MNRRAELIAFGALPALGFHEFRRRPASIMMLQLATAGTRKRYGLTQGKHYPNLNHARAAEFRTTKTFPARRPDDLAIAHTTSPLDIVMTGQPVTDTPS